MPIISRRTLLQRSLLLIAAAGGAAAGLTKSVHHKVALPPAPPPPTLVAALGVQKRLLAGYDTVLATSPGQAALASLRADIAAHGDALQAVLENYPGWRYARSQAAVQASTGAPAAADNRTTLAKASQAAADAAYKACLAWPSNEPHAAQVVPLLGSIAACLITHVEVLT
jgi:hypothetical protein